MLPGEPPDTLPGTAKPHHAVHRYLRHDLVQDHGIDLRRKVVGFARLANGDTVQSKATRLHWRA
jgi:hypothetical protein